MHANTQAFVATLLFAIGTHTAFPQGSAFSYQGHLTDAGKAATGPYDLRFALHDAGTNGGPVGSAVMLDDVAVSDGLFTVTLDFGAAAFNGAPRWLEIGVRPGDSTGDYTTLLPRQQIVATPYALHAAEAARLVGTLSDAQVPGTIARLNKNQTFTGTVTFQPSAGAPFAVGNATLVPNLNADLLDGLHASAFTNGNAHTVDGLHAADFWQLHGNSGTSPGSDFVGTTDNKALELKVGGMRALRLEPAPSFAAGYRAKAPHAGAYVWADTQSFDFPSERTNQVRLRASGGLDFVTAVDRLGSPSARVTMTSTGGVSVSVVSNTLPALELRQGSLKVTGAGLGTPTPVFIHRATASNRISNGLAQYAATVIDHPLCNGDPNAILMVTPNFNPGDGVGGQGVWIQKAVGVLYTGNTTADLKLRQKWAISYLEGTTMDTGTAFNVFVVKP
jgi:hypothetical protein